MSESPKCMKCERTDTAPWTVTRGGALALVDLCSDHDVFLREIIGEEKLQLPPARRGVPRIINKKPSKLRPLDWTPPS